MAFRAMALYMQDRMWPFTAKFFRRVFTLAIERRDRLYFSSSLRVYGKDIAFITMHMATLIEDGARRLRAGQAISFDAFDPRYMQCALRLPDNLGHLIFGAEEWARLAQQWN
ncbi:hypothetical protein LXA43DRAFT_1097235 [Ganoderma leucocontextum]|nr:hypothetical protein LXA43DRAFT_1097235 [Ganoderma leucocontextum]